MPRRSHPPRPSGAGGRQQPGRGPRRAGTGEQEESTRPGSGWQRAESTRDGDFLVRTVPGAMAGKSYRCPGCQQIIQPGTAHLVVWPEWISEHEGGVADRRHWHTACWQRRAARGGPGRLG